MATREVRVWDLPVRLTHWSFAILVPAMWIAAENSAWDWHIRMGHALLALVLFRIIWGFVGTDTARFANFVGGPRRVMNYLRGGYDAKREKGHNPLGALSVLALLGALLVQVSLGLFSGDPYDGATGPLNSLVGVMTADAITELHEVFFWALAGLIAIHILAIGFYGAVRGQNLIGAMISGKDDKAPSVSDNPTPQWGRALAALAVAAGIAVWIYVGAPPLT